MWALVAGPHSEASADANRRTFARVSLDAERVRRSVAIRTERRVGAVAVLPLAAGIVQLAHLVGHLTALRRLDGHAADAQRLKVL